MTNPTAKKRLNLTLSDAAYELLQELSDASGRNMADVLRSGLALYGIAADAAKDGDSLGIVNKDTVKKEIVIAELPSQRPSHSSQP